MCYSYCIFKNKRYNEENSNRKATTNMQKHNEFIEGLLKEKDIFIDDPEAKKQVVADMTKKLEEEINRAAVESLSEEKAKELAEKIDSPDFTTEKTIEFIKDSGVDIEKITEDTKNRFREFYLKGEEK